MSDVWQVWDSYERFLVKQCSEKYYNTGIHSRVIWNQNIGNSSDKTWWFVCYNFKSWDRWSSNSSTHDDGDCDDGDDSVTIVNATSNESDNDFSDENEYAFADVVLTEDGNISIGVRVAPTQAGNDIIQNNAVIGLRRTILLVHWGIKMRKKSSGCQS